MEWRFHLGTAYPRTRSTSLVCRCGFRFLLIRHKTDATRSEIAVSYVCAQLCRTRRATESAAETDGGYR